MKLIKKKDNSLFKSEKTDQYATRRRRWVKRKSPYYYPKLEGPSTQHFIYLTPKKLKKEENLNYSFCSFNLVIVNKIFYLVPLVPK